MQKQKQNVPFWRRQDLARPGNRLKLPDLSNPAGFNDIEEQRKERTKGGYCQSLPIAFQRPQRMSSVYWGLNLLIKCGVL
jgi:hypothetical protein